jgi:hypothetical protein
LTRTQWLARVLDVHRLIRVHLAAVPNRSRITFDNDLESRLPRAAPVGLQLPTEAGPGRINAKRIQKILTAKIGDLHGDLLAEKQNGI